MKKRKDGRYRKIVDGVNFYGSSERELMRKIREYEDRRDEGPTFLDISDEWWGDTYDVLSPNSVKGYKAALKRANAQFGDMRIKDITTPNITAWLKRLGNLGYAYKTVKNHKIVVSRIFQHAISLGYLNYNPATLAEPPRNLSKKKRPPATAEDERKVRASAHIWLFPFAALMTGLRKGELLALQWKDIDFNQDEISVTKSVFYSGNTPKIKAPKSEAGIRTVILLDELKAELIKRKGDPEGYIFSEDGGKTPYKEMRYDVLMKNYQKQTGVAATAHQLRKTFATIAAASGIDKKVLQRIMGHTDIRLTLDVYSSVRDSAWDDAKTKLNTSNTKG
jgi:integrase